MSQFRVKKGQTSYSYGFDRPLSEYFLTAFRPDGPEDLVGSMSDAYGSNTNLQMKMESEEIWLMIPAEHRMAIQSDLPF